MRPRRHHSEAVTVPLLYTAAPPPPTRCSWRTGAVLVPDVFLELRCDVLVYCRKGVLENMPLRRRKLGIHFSIPKDNSSDKDVNQGTLVIFNLDPSVSNDDLKHIFGACGEVKEIRETPHRLHHIFIEFYDVRSAESALRSLNKSDLAGKRIKLEPSRPGGARRMYVHHFCICIYLLCLQHTKSVILVNNGIKSSIIHFEGFQ
ncbi:hypothetical protein ZIOFF_063382 [Zingiber officinale]|uniref:RRM domain-containing protein n=1 Tax=Zingiber officinale TaxID=94328 RepID=A0A8J5KB72_ZINOF|nr:hypothetical protein ZIOFF_063382 [Zingiber officinale]